jgi:tetratricopeptide (TPR) repeat protein
MNEKTQSASDSNELTRIDLGDDLLEKTALIVPQEEEKKAPEFLPQESHSESHATSPREPETVVDLLHSARILVTEGLFEDAKKILHRILIQDSSNALARQQLEEIHATELKQIFGDTETRKPYARRIRLDVSKIDSDAMMRQLDKDLNLGVFSPEPPPAIGNELSLLEDPALVSAFCENLERDLSKASVQDWIDLGIGFLEMDLVQIAARLFAGACRKLDLEFTEQSLSQENEEARLSATFLLSFSLIIVGRPYEAISKIQPLLTEIHLKTEQKTELFYLMGRTYESMRKWGLATEFYEQVIEVDAQYRDVDLRIRKVREAQVG